MRFSWAYLLLFEELISGYFPFWWEAAFSEHIIISDELWKKIRCLQVIIKMSIFSVISWLKVICLARSLVKKYWSFDGNQHFSDKTNFLPKLELIIEESPSSINALDIHLVFNRLSQTFQWRILHRTKIKEWRKTSA